MQYMDLTPFFWFLMEQNNDHVVYRLKNNPFIEVKIQPDGAFAFIGYGPFTEHPEMDVSVEAQHEAAELADFYLNA